MLIKFSGLVSGVSGKLNGSKLYKGRSGSVMSNKVKPKNPNTPGQIAQRAFLRYYSGLFASLLIAGIIAWNDAGAQLTKKNRVGDSHKIAGFNLYIIENTRNKHLYNLPWSGGTPASSLNVDLASPPAPLAPTVNGNLAAPAIVGGSTQTMVIDIPLISTGDVLVISATPGYSAGKSFIKGKMRPFLVMPAHAAQPAFDIYAAYAANFGAVVASKVISFSAEYFSITGSKTSKFIAGSTITHAVA